jgi:hypothetical protein
MIVMELSAPEIVKEAVSTASVINHLKNNRIEYLLFVGILHLMGVSDRLLATMSGVCF